MIGNPALDIKKANPWKKQEKYGEIHEGKNINKFHETGNEFEESPTRKGRPLGDGHQILTITVTSQWGRNTIYRDCIPIISLLSVKSHQT